MEDAHCYNLEVVSSNHITNQENKTEEIAWVLKKKNPSTVMETSNKITWKPKGFNSHKKLT